MPIQLSQVSILSTGADLGAGGAEAPPEMLKGATALGFGAGTAIQRQFRLSCHCKTTV